MSVTDQHNNLSWIEGDLWYGWVYRPDKNRFYFDDIGHESLIELWEYQWEIDPGLTYRYDGEA
jgi:hypothetical protein